MMFIGDINNLDFFGTDMAFAVDVLLLVSFPPRISSDGFKACLDKEVYVRNFSLPECP